jgi:hypothetical protein
MSASKAPVRGPKIDPSDGDPAVPQHPLSKPPPAGEPLPEPTPGAIMVRGPWALSEGPGQISWDHLVDHTLLQSHAHLPPGDGMGRNRQAIARIEAQSQIKRYFAQRKPR